MKFPAHPITRCRICHHTGLREILSLGNQTVSTFVAPGETAPVAPLTLLLCDPSTSGCGLVQLKHTSPANSLYRHYWYKSGVNASMKSALRDVAQSAVKRHPLQTGEIVLDIGANDGTLLREFRRRDLRKIAVEPAINLTGELSRHADTVINDFYTHRAFIKASKGKKAAIITTVAMFYDLEDPNSFVSDLRKSIARNGLWVNQMASLYDMVKYTMFDNVCHEHIEYYSLAALERLLARHKFMVVDLEINDVNGGSMRVYATPAAYAHTYVTPQSTIRLRHYRALEKTMRLEDPQTYRQFSRRVTRYKHLLHTFIAKAKTKGKTVWGYGASTKGNTLLQYFQFNDRILAAIAERNPLKWGRVTAGTRIPIVSESAMRKAKPTYLLILPWHFRPEFIRREQAYLRGGGTMIFPLPRLSLVTMKHGKLHTTYL